MDFKLAVTGTVSVPDDGSGIESLKDRMAEVVQEALLGLRGVEPLAFFLQVGAGTQVNVHTIKTTADTATDSAGS